MACCRAGRYDAAIRHLQWADGALVYNSASAKALVVMAMAYKGLDQPKKAHEYLAKARQAFAACPTVKEGDLGSEWHDWLVFDILLREVESTEE